MQESGTTVNPSFTTRIFHPSRDLSSCQGLASGQAIVDLIDTVVVAKEAAQVLGEAMDYARQGQIAAMSWNQPQGSRVFLGFDTLLPRRARLGSDGKSRRA